MFKSDEDWILCIFRTILEYNENVDSPFYEEVVSNQYQSIELNKIIQCSLYSVLQ